MFKFRYAFTTRAATKFIFVHHAYAKKASAADIHRWHLERGWNGIGYHKVIRKNAMIEEGRPLWAKGAHAEGFNDVSIGVCFEGSFDKEKINEGQWDAGVNELIALREQYPEAIIVGHGWFNNTSCPGMPNAVLCKMIQQVEEKLVARRIEASKSKLQKIYDRFDRVLKRRRRR